MIPSLLFSDMFLPSSCRSSTALTIPSMYSSGSCSGHFSALLESEAFQAINAALDVDAFFDLGPT